MHTYEPTNRLPDVLDMMEGDGTLHTGESIVPSALLSRLGTSLPHPRVSKVSRALAYAHERGVMDWGLARLEGDGTEEVHEADMSDFQTSGGGSAERIRLAKAMDGAVIGTPGYMSPEQGRGELQTLDARSDIWNLGFVLCEILTLMPAYSDKDPHEVIRKSQAEPPQDPHQVAPMRRIPDEVGDAVEAFLEGVLQRERALELVGEARTIIGWVAQQRLDAAGLRSESAKLLEGVADHALEDRRAAGWEKDDGALSLGAKADLDEVGFLQTARSALERVPDLDEVHSLLADYYQGKHAGAEASQDAAAAARFDLLLSSYDQGQHDEYIKGVGASPW